MDDDFESGIAPPSEIYYATVTRFNISSNTVDVVTIDDEISLLNCQVACSMPAGFAFGTKYTPSHNDSNLETGYVHSPGDIYCIATFVGNDYNNAVILGFLLPKETTLSIPDYGLYLFRHESDVMWMIRGDGTIQVYHPSGSIIKIGSDDSNEMSESVMIPTKANSFNVRDAADYNRGKSSNLYIKWHAGQNITIDSSGNLNIEVPTKINITTPEVYIDSYVNISTGATGTFSTPDGKVVVVTNGIVTSISPI